MKATFKTLRSQSANLKNDGIREALDYAENNANDTIYVEKAAASEDFDRLALGSITSTSPYVENAAVRRWFAKRGI